MIRLAYLIATLAALLAVVPVRADDRPVVSHVEVYARDGAVRANLRCQQLFSERVVGTVESGLPAVVELLYRLVDSRGKELRRGLYALELSYDVWDDVYSLTSSDSTRTFASFDDMGRAVERLRGVAVTPISELNSAGTYAVEFSVTVHPLKGAEREQIVGWVNEQVVGQSSRSWRERVLNIGDLVNGIFSHEREKSFQSEWQRSVSFTPQTMRNESSGGYPAGTPLQVAVRLLVGARDRAFAGGAF